MKKRLSWLAIALFLQWLCVGAVNAEQVTVNVSAVVNDVYDPAGVVADITPGESLNGHYTYETTTPDLEPIAEIGIYPHTGGTGELDLAVGAYRIVMDGTLSNALEIFIDDEYYPDSEYYSVASSMIMSNNGVDYSFVALDMSVSGASVLASADLTAEVPNPVLFNDKRLYIEGSKNGQMFWFTADLTELSTGEPLVIQENYYEYQADAEVTYLYDPMGVLAGKVELSTPVNLGFAYDLATPNTSSYPGEGQYLHAPGTGKVTASFADVSLATDPTAQTPDVYVFNNDDPAGWDHLGMFGRMVQSNNTAIVVNSIDVFFDGPGTVLNSSEMPAGTLSLAGWESARVFINGDGWYVEARLTALAPVSSSIIDRFPADGVVHPMQRFDMGLRVNNMPAVIELYGEHNGQDISPYLAGCAIMPTMDSTQSIVCFDTASLLMPGVNALQLKLLLEDGSTVTTEALWEVRD